MEPTLRLACGLTLALLFYSYLGYLGVIVLLARLSGRRPASGVARPRVSLLVPAHNEAAVMRAKLENSLALDYPADLCEVIVASDGSSDDTVALARTYAGQRVQVLDGHPRRGKAAVLNDAVAASRGEVLVFCDANVLFEPDAVSRLVARLADPRVGAVSGDVRLASHESNFEFGETLYYRLERRLQQAESGLGALIGVDGGMYALRRELFRPLPEDTILDDFVNTMAALRAGARVEYEPWAVARENGTPTARIEFARRVRVTAGMIQVIKRGQLPWGRPLAMWQFASHKLLRLVDPLLLLTLLAGTAWLSRVDPWARGLLAVQLVCYALAGIAAVVIPFRRTRWGGIPFYFVLGHAAILVGSWKGLWNRQRVTWQVTPRAPREPAPPWNSPSNSGVESPGR